MKKLLAILLCAVIAFGLFGCSNKSNDDKNTSNEAQTEETSKSYEVDESLIDVEITIPASLFSKEDPATDELTQEQKDLGFKSAKLNEDGSVTYKMSKKAYKEYLETMKTQTQENLNSLSEDYNSIKSVECNDDFSEITIKVEKSAYEQGMDFLAIPVAGIAGNMYQAIAGYDEEKMSSTVKIVDQDTGEELNSGTYPTEDSKK